MYDADMSGIEKLITAICDAVDGTSDATQSSPCQDQTSCQTIRRHLRKECDACMPVSPVLTISSSTYNSLGVASD